MITHAIGVGGYSIYGDELPLSSLILFLSFDVNYASPSVIKREITSAKEKDLIHVSEKATITIAEKGRQIIEDLGITDGLNFKFHKTNELESKGRKMIEDGKDGLGMISLADDLRRQVSREGLFWYPEEWKSASSPMPSSQPSRQPPQKQAAKQPQASDIQVVRKPRSVKKVK
jgi:hypothetical protein